MEYDYRLIGKRIADRRNDLGIKQCKLAETLNISNNHLSGIENGREKPSMDTFLDICDALKTSPYYFLCGVTQSSNITKRIVDSLNLCSEGDLVIIDRIVQLYVDKNSSDWNKQNPPI
jgi:transcriptional regulator with XRE-family HTH domain